MDHGMDRQPPRYVPTLTDVVPQGLPIHRPASHAASQEAPEAVPLPAASEGPQEPEWMPIASADIGTPEPELPPAYTPQTSPLAAALEAQQLHEATVARLMERVAPLLEERLRYAVEEMVRSQTDALVSQLRNAVEEVVRDAVADAVADEQRALRR